MMTIMMMVIGMMVGVINDLSGTMVMKNARLKSLNKIRVNAYCLASIKILGLVYVRR